jgi:hypothetical protein
MSMRFSWRALILAPLLVPALFAAVLGALLGNNPVFGFLFLFIPGCIVSYATTIVLFLPSLYLVSLWRPLTRLKVCLVGLVLGSLVYLPMTVLDWQSSGPDSGPPEETFLAFLLRCTPDPFNAIYPSAGLITAGAYWWLAVATSKNPD